MTQSSILSCDNYTLSPSQQKQCSLNLYLSQDRVIRALQTEAEVKVKEWAQDQELAWYTHVLMADTYHRALKLAEKAPLDGSDELLTGWWRKIMECQNYAYYCQIHKAEIIKQAVRIILNADKAEDLYQELVLELLRRVEKVEAPSPIRFLDVWLKQCIKSRALNELRNSQNHDAKTGGSPLLLSQLPVEQEAKSDQRQLLSGNVESEDIFSTLRSLISSVKNPIYRSVLMYSFVDGYSVKEISELLGRPQQTVKNDLHRGHNALRKMYFISYPHQREKLMLRMKQHAIPEEEQTVLKQYFFEGKDGSIIRNTLLKTYLHQDKALLGQFVKATLEKWKDQLNVDMNG